MPLITVNNAVSVLRTERYLTREMSFDNLLSEFAGKKSREESRYNFYNNLNVVSYWMQTLSLALLMFILVDKT